MNEHNKENTSTNCKSDKVNDKSIDNNDMKIQSNNINIKQNSNFNIDSVYSECGYTKHHLKIFLMTFLAISCEGLLFYLISALLVPFKLYYDLNDVHISILSSITFLGFGIGSYSIGLFTNTFERKTLLILSFIGITILQFLTGLIISLTILCLLRFLLGVFLGFIVPIVNNIFIEYLPIRLRGFMLVIVWAGFAFGQLVVIILIYLIMPMFESSELGKLQSCISLYFAFVTVLQYIYLENSPRNLLISEKYEQAYTIIEKLLGKQLTNNEKQDLKNQYISYELSFRDSDDYETLKDEVKLNKSNHIQENKSRYLIDLKKNRLIIIVCCLIGFFKSISIYGKMMIENIAAVDILNFYNSKKVVKLKDILNSQEANGNNSLSNMFQVVFTGMIGVVVGAFLIEVTFFGRKNSCTISTMLNILVISMMLYDYGNFVFYSASYNFFTSIFFNIYGAYYLEILPSTIRDTASGLIYGTIRIGGILSQFMFSYFYKSNVFLPFYFMNVLEILVLILAFSLPTEPNDTPLS